MPFWRETKKKLNDQILDYWESKQVIIKIGPFSDITF
jgi:hypothetical protein